MYTRLDVLWEVLQRVCCGFGVKSSKHRWRTVVRQEREGHQSPDEDVRPPIFYIRALEAKLHCLARWNQFPFQWVCYSNKYLNIFLLKKLKTGLTLLPCSTLRNIFEPVLTGFCFTGLRRRYVLDVSVLPSRSTCIQWKAHPMQLIYAASGITARKAFSKTRPVLPYKKIKP